MASTVAQGKETLLEVSGLIFKKNTTIQSDKVLVRKQVSRYSIF